MNSIVNAMPKYDHRQHFLSDWLAELDQSFQLGEVDEDTNRPRGASSSSAPPGQASSPA